MTNRLLLALMLLAFVACKRNEVTSVLLSETDVVLSVGETVSVGSGAGVLSLVLVCGVSQPVSPRANSEASNKHFGSFFIFGSSFRCRCAQFKTSV